MAPTALENSGNHEPFRRWLEDQYSHAKQLTPRALFALGGSVQYVYGAAGAADISSDRGLIEYALRFANGEEDTDSRQWFLEGQRSRRKRRIELLPMVEAGFARQKADLTPERIEAARTRIGAILDSILTSVRESTRETLERSENLLRGVWALNVLHREPHLHLAVCQIITDIEAFNAFIAVLLLDPKLPLGRDLKRCLFEPCGRFFLMHKPQGGGRPRSRYCSDECMEQANALTSGERSAASREGMSVKAWREHQRRRKRK